MSDTHRLTTLHNLPRRRFAVLLPLGGLAWLAGCSKSTEQAPAPAPAPTPAPAPMPAPAADSTPPATAPAAPGAGSAGLPMVDPADPTAKTLAYVTDASTVVAASNPKYQPGQACGSCALYGGQPGAAAGPCPLFAGRQVSALAWCNAYTKKA